MADKAKTTPEEIPLHEVVLKLMFEANKEKPAELTPEEVFWEITDPTLIQRNITEVLNWLVGQKRAEEYEGKYYLERMEFLNFRNIHRGLTDPSGEKVKNESKTKKSTEEEIPLHDIILKQMFDANKEEPARLTVNDIFWKSSDPSLRESIVEDVLKWLLHHRRVEYRGGKYALDKLEFLDLTKSEKIETVKEKVKVKDKKPEVSKPPVKKAPKVVIPPAPEEVKDPIAESPKKPKITPKPKKAPSAPKQKETVITPEPVKVKEKVLTEIQVDEGDSKLSMALLLVTVCFFAYTCYLLISMSTLTTTRTSEKLKTEITSMQSELMQLSENEITTNNKTIIVEEKLKLLQEISLKQSEQTAIQNVINTTTLKSVITKLVVSNSILLLLIITFLYYWKKNIKFFKK